MITVAAFSDSAHAHIARGFLEAEGIESEIADEHVVGVHWLYSNAIGGVKLLVPETDVARALELLGRRSEVSPEESVEFRAVAGSGDQCPSCDSEDVVPSHLAERIKALTLLGILPTVLAVPFVLWSNEWRCKECGHTWKPNTETDA
jgi:hypothetical protein